MPWRHLVEESQEADKTLVTKSLYNIHSPSGLTHRAAFKSDLKEPSHPRQSLRR